MLIVKKVLKAMLVVAVAFQATAAAKNNFLSEEAVSKMQVKKLISGKQDAIKRVATTFDFYTDSIYDIYNIIFSLQCFRVNVATIILLLILQNVIIEKYWF